MLVLEQAVVDEEHEDCGAEEYHKNILRVPPGLVDQSSDCLRENHKDSYPNHKTTGGSTDEWMVRGSSRTLAENEEARGDCDEAYAS